MKGQKEKSRKQSHLPLHQKEKYLGINLHKEAKDLYSKNYIMKEIEDDTNRWKDIPCSCIGRINIVKNDYIIQAIYKFSATPIKLSMAFFTELEQKF